MAREKSQGTCLLCKGTFPKASMTRHLARCLPAHDAELPGAGKAKQGKLCHVVVEGKYDPRYWLHLELPATATLAALDHFLRDIWLECCGHLSAFKIEGKKAQFLAGVAGWDRDPGELNMAIQVGKHLHKGVKLLHEYDFGSMTSLTLKGVGEREGPIVKANEVRLLARNDPPSIPCGICHKNQAVFIDMENSWDEGGWFCEQCAREHDLDTEEMVLPVVNSPRTGVCGYTGD